MNHPLAHIPTSQRIDITLAVLSAMPIQEAGGWTYQRLADVCGCSRSAIQQREAIALKKARFRSRNLKRELNNHQPSAQ